MQWTAQTAEQLHQRWAVQDAVAVGREIFEPLSPAQRVARGAAVLAVAAARVATPQAVADLLKLAGEPDRWSEGHDAFSAIRKLTLAEERQPTRRAYNVLLLLAEGVAKTVYNASGSTAPFDEDAPWWIAACARSLVDAVDDTVFEQKVWASLLGPRD